MNKKTLVIVESPTKAKTIEKYLGNRKYTVVASMGHLRDLPKSQFGIDVEHDFTPKYINIRGKGDLIKSLKKAAKKANGIYLASDPDREGEAIAWHLAYILGVDESTPCRIVFNEITKPAIQEAVKNPKPINLSMVDAQQARRMLDRIVGYKLSPLLWKKIKKGLSAGRVQSVTLKMICDREKEIQKFVSEEYWTVALKFKKKPKSTSFNAELTAVDNRKLMISAKQEDIKISSKAEADDLLAKIKEVDFKVSDIKKSTRQRKAPAPFTTSSLQQDAARKLGFTSRQTMMIAQQLYEGINLGRKGHTGLITYMRTDSTRISELALGEVRDYIKEKIGEEYLPEKPNLYGTKKSAQDAHEAVRPTNVSLLPAEIEGYLSKEQFKLYKLIWQRFVASQMLPATYHTVSIVATGDIYTAKASGSQLVFSGFKAIYNDGDKAEKDVLLPELAVGDELSIFRAETNQHFTEPPARYNEASLIKLLEEKGIGRPSTYAPIIETMVARRYVSRVDKKFQPTELGNLVVDLLEEYFTNILEPKFTANLESKLDEIAVGEFDKTELLREFYGPFEKALVHAEEEIDKMEFPDEVSDIPCELCGRMMVYKQGRYGKFLACPGFPECRNTKTIIKDTGVPCPKCGGKIIERKSRKARVFYGCENFPKCDFVSWDMPVKDKHCEVCGSFMYSHRFKTGRTILYCSNDNCPTRKEDTPINKELNKIRMKAEKQAQEKLQKELEKEKQAQE